MATVAGIASAGCSLAVVAQYVDGHFAYTVGGSGLGFFVSAQLYTEIGDFVYT